MEDETQQQEQDDVQEEEEEMTRHDDDTRESSDRRLPPALAAARDHSYLPGNSHPLLVVPQQSSSSSCGGSIVIGGGGSSTMTAQGSFSHSSSQSQSQQHQHHHQGGGGYKGEETYNDNTSSSSRNTISIIQQQQQQQKKLPILELQGVVLFPGSTIPIRLVRERALLQYLARQIELCRHTPHLQPQVQLGILTQPHIVTTTRRNNDDDVDDDYDYDDYDDSPPQQQQQQQRRRRQRRRQRQRQMMGEVPPRQHQQQEQQHRFVSRIGTIATITYTHEMAALDNPSLGDSISNTSDIWQQRRSLGGGETLIGREELVVTAIGTQRFRVMSYIQEDSFADLNVFQVQVLPDTPLHLPPIGRLFASSPQELKDRNEQQQQQQHPSSLPSHPFGIHHDRLIWNLSMLTSVPYCAYRANTWPWRLMEKIITSIEEYNRKGGSTQFLPTLLGRGNEEEKEDDTTAITEEMRGGSATAATTALDQNHRQTVPVAGHNNTVTSNVVTSTNNSNSDNDSNDSSNNNNHDTTTTTTYLYHQYFEPISFSYHLASNLPFTEREKLKLLEFHSTVERLRMIYDRVLQYTQTEWYLCCQECQMELAKVTDVFIFGGAEGSTSNYVNPDGFIHQITTLRHVSDTKLFFQGRPQTDNSYFPGYSWTITYCRSCYHHLGWKFQCVHSHHGGNDEDEDEDHRNKNQPMAFFGFMSSALNAHD